MEQQGCQGVKRENTASMIRETEVASTPGTGTQMRLEAQKPNFSLPVSWYLYALNSPQQPPLMTEQTLNTQEHNIVAKFTSLEAQKKPPNNQTKHETEQTT